MKKLLSILTISTLTASIPAPLLANTTLTRVKHDVSIMKSNSNNEHLLLEKIFNMSSTQQINSVAVDSKDNIYFIWLTLFSNGLFVLKQGSDTPTKIDGINVPVFNVTVDSKDNIYIVTDNGAYKLSAGSDTAIKINGITNVNSIFIDNKNCIYFATKEGAFVLKQGSDTPIKINGINDWIYSIIIDKDNNIYFGTKNGAFVLKKGATTPTKIDGINGVC